MFNPDKVIVVTDIETGGLELHHPIIQIAAIATLKGVEVDSFECKIEFDPEECEAEALTINHYSPEAWLDAIPMKEAISRLAIFYKKYAQTTRKSKKGWKYQVAIGAGYNSHFDTDRLFYRARGLGIFLPVDPRFLDVMQLALWKLHLTGYKLTDIATHFSIPTDNAHDALADVRLTLACMNRLTAGL
jgi:DNA polymerase III epsilon subunit-like protein